MFTLFLFYLITTILNLTKLNYHIYFVLMNLKFKEYCKNYFISLHGHIMGIWL